MRMTTTMKANNERGIALVLALFLMSALTVLGASLMFLSQTETYASMNYRMMSQARYAGEAGVQKAASFLLDTTQYTLPTVAQVGTEYDTNKSPVTCISGAGCTNVNGPVIISASAAMASNYPDTTVQGLFNTAAQGTLAAGNATITFDAYATLISMQTFDTYAGTPDVVQTWRITGTGGLTGARNATVEVVALVETPKVPANQYAAFGTNNNCGALTIDGNVLIDSYDSSTLTGATAPTLLGDGGDLGTNGNLSLGGTATVHGNLYTPRTGVGSCSEGAVTALTESGSANLPAENIIQLPTPVTYPTPARPAPSALPGVVINSADATTCALLGAFLPPASCTVIGNDIIIDSGVADAEVSLPTVAMSGSVNIRLVAYDPPTQYNFNSLSLAAGAAIGIQATSPDQGVFVHIVGQAPDGSEILPIPLDFTGGSYTTVTGCATCSNYDATMLQFVYSGTGEIKMEGNSSAAASFYAPNASVRFEGSADLYGSVLAASIHRTGSGNIYYDQTLQEDFWVIGHPMVGSFTWVRY